MHPLPDPDRSFTVSTLGELERRAEAWGGRWRHVWLTPDAVRWFDLPARRRGPLDTAGGFVLRAAQWEPGSPFVGIGDALELYRELWRLEVALGVGWFSSGAVTSDVLLRSLHRPPRARAIERTTLPAVAVAPGARRPPGRENPFMWHRAPIGWDTGDYVHHFDLNAAYLAAASKLRLPQGEPVQLDDEHHDDAGRYPGYWRVELDPWSVGTLPAPWGNRPARETETWITTPTLRLLRDIEWPARVIDGWYWPRTCEALTPWYERLRDARASLSGPGRKAVGQVYKMGIGRLESVKRKNTDDPLYQPAWTHHVIAEARARVFRRIATLRRAPLAVEVDSVWIQHESADPLEAAAAVGLPIGDGLGRWKVLGRIPALEAHAILTGPARAVFARLKECEGA